mmetsp:Transcript_24987/g.56519  ORF Transcript_24987/g.56519 Transcript_24987/m.56519 type:complete len:120 (-) Transcript_24987:402-761(-)
MAEGEWVDGRLVHDDLAHHRPAPGHDHRPLRRSGGGHSSELNLGSLDALPGARRRVSGNVGGSTSLGSVGSRRSSDHDDVRTRRHRGDFSGSYPRRESAASMGSSGEFKGPGRKNQSSS